MINIIQRLRGFADANLPLETLEQILLAADELERLQTELRVPGGYHELHTENMRLQAALRDIADGAWNIRHGVNYTASQFARRALEKRWECDLLLMQR